VRDMKQQRNELKTDVCDVVEVMGVSDLLNSRIPEEDGLADCNQCIWVRQNAQFS